MPQRAHGRTQDVTDAAFVILFEPQADGTLVATAATDGVDLGLMRIDPRTEASATAEVWRTGTTIYIADAVADPRASTRLATLTGPNAALIQPVTREGRITAVLAIGFCKGRQEIPNRRCFSSSCWPPRSGSRSTADVIARWGGEEFALAFLDCDLAQAHTIATRVLTVIPGGQTASIGLTQFCAQDTPPSPDRTRRPSPLHGKEQRP